MLVPLSTAYDPSSLGQVLNTCPPTPSMAGLGLSSSQLGPYELNELTKPAVLSACGCSVTVASVAVRRSAGRARRSATPSA